MIPVTKPYLPSREKLNKYIDGIYEREWLTNNGELVQELTRRLEAYLGVKHLLLVANGTLALQVAYRALGITGQDSTNKPEIITTPFTFVATASSQKWEGAEPVFVDIDADTWCLDPNKIEAAITKNTKAIVPVHVFGNACDVHAIGHISQKNNLKVIYDASHAFGVKYQGESLLKHGDAATLSFHATKLFHTGEGGAIVFKKKEDYERAKKMINFGITGPETIKELGINAKMSELHAAMGLSVLDEIEKNLSARAKIWQRYEQELGGKLKLQKISDDIEYNYAYFPALFDSEEQTQYIKSALKKNGVETRRYFFPSLNTLEEKIDKVNLYFSEDISLRVLCFPIYYNIKEQRVLDVFNSILKKGLK